LAQKYQTDCEALKNRLVNVSADTPRNIDFADQPKQHATELGHQIHKGLQSIIGYAHADYDKKRVNIRLQNNTPKTVGEK